MDRGSFSRSELLILAKRARAVHDRMSQAETHTRNAFAVQAEILADLLTPKKPYTDESRTPFGIGDQVWLEDMKYTVIVAGDGVLVLQKALGKDVVLDIVSEARRFLDSKETNALG